MPNATITTIKPGYIRVIPSEGYLLRRVGSQRYHSVVECPEEELKFYVAEKV